MACFESMCFLLPGIGAPVDCSPRYASARMQRHSAPILAAAIPLERRTVCLLTCTLIQNKIRKTRRSTLWQYTEVGWKILFHQGTMVEGC